MVKLFRTEESKIGMVYLVTGVVMFVTSLSYAGETAPFMVPIVIAGSAVVLLIVLAAMVYEMKVSKERPEIQDERSALCSLKATRNAFVIALLALAVYMIFGWLGAPLEKIQALQAVWGFALTGYTVSYFYYKRVH
jgi:hypothetical protein